MICRHLENYGTPTWRLKFPAKFVTSCENALKGVRLTSVKTNVMIPVTVSHITKCIDRVPNETVEESC